jgi:hypothetical protein
MCAPQLYERARDNIANMTRANYFYITAYPTYSGCRIEHDPILTAYITQQVVPEFPAILIIPIFMAISAYIFICTRKRQLRKARHCFP